MDEEIKIEVGDLLVFNLNVWKNSDRIGIAIERSHKCDLYDQILHTNEIPNDTEHVWKIFWVRDLFNRSSVFGYYTELTLRQLFYENSLYIFK